MKKSALCWFILSDVGILQIFYSRAGLQRINVDSPAFLEPGLAEKIAVCAHCPCNPSAEELEGLDGLLYKATQTFEVF
jgi:hypothetical protein